MRYPVLPLLSASLVLCALGCGDDGPAAPDDAAVGDAGQPDAGPTFPASTDHCDYEPSPPTARAGGTVTAGAVSAGAAELALPVEVGATLGAYTARAAGFGGGANSVDRRFMEVSGTFNPSIGIETRPMARALALTAGDETIVLVQADLGIADEELTFRIADALGPDFSGKVALLTSHTHSGWAHYTTHSGMQVGFGAIRARVQEAISGALIDVARAALDARVPARVGIAHDAEFDLADRVNRDRRGENDDLAGGSFDDHDLFVIRVDASDDGRPIAVLPVFGMHGTLNDADNQLASTDAPGAVARALEEAFDEPVVVMHLQGAGGDVSPVGTGGTDCGEGPCYAFARAESVGRNARDAILTAWEDAGAVATDELAMEMVTRPVELGPDWETFTVRDGALRYAPFDGQRVADGIVYEGDGSIASPIDEFNAPYGAALCGEDHTAYFLRGQLKGTERVLPYKSCVAVDIAAEILGEGLLLPFEPSPVCGSTRTVVSAIRLGEHLLVTVPGEPVTLFAERLRELSPVAPDKTIVLGYASHSNGYLMTVEDWLLGGYEPSINFWGPLQGEHVAEETAALMQMAMTDEREDATEGAPERYAPPVPPDDLPPADPAPMAGTLPDSVPDRVYVRGGEPVGTDTRPPSTVPRLGLARMVWIGEDPASGTPRVTLQREQTPGDGDFVDVTRRSGRVVSDHDVLLFHTPQPFVREGDDPRTHYWAAEWQAVVPWGTPDLDDLADRPGLPLGRYRLHVEGDGYTLDSDPIEVVPATLAVTGSVAGDSLTLGVTYAAPSNGFRLLDSEVSSNGPVPLRQGPVTVELTLADGSVHVLDALEPAAGDVVVDLSSYDSDVASARVVDRFDNEGTWTP